MKTVLEYLNQFGEVLLQSLGLKGMQDAYGTVPVNIWYNTMRKEVKSNA